MGRKARLVAAFGAVVLMVGLASCAEPKTSSDADGLMVAGRTRASH
ncbi:hypothetical protein ACGFNU_35115 [Spirillospora sp. NPDC048911]